MPDFRLAIDYGTSNTVAVLRWPDGRIQPLLFDSSPLIGSAAYLTDYGQLLCGRDAERSARLDPTAFEPHPKRRVGEYGVLLRDRVIEPVDLVASTLRRIGAEAARAAGQAPAEVVMTYPAAWGVLRRGVLTKAATLAGLPTPTLIPEPVAAAAYFTTVLGHRVAPGRVVVVYDLGAGTLDVSAVRGTPDGFEVLAVDGLPDFGGVDLDAIVVAQARPGADEDTWRRLTAPTTAADRRHFRALWDEARAAKEMLSRLSGVTLHLPLVDRDLPIGREDFESRAEPTLRRTGELTARVIERSGATGDELAGLFLVGGSSRVPMVATTLHRATGIAPTVLEQPELVVAEGALHAAATRQHAQPEATGAPPPLPSEPDEPDEPVPAARAETSPSWVMPWATVTAIVVFVALVVVAVWVLPTDKAPAGGTAATSDCVPSGEPLPGHLHVSAPRMLNPVRTSANKPMPVRDGLGGRHVGQWPGHIWTTGTDGNVATRKGSTADYIWAAVIFHDPDNGDSIRRAKANMATLRSHGYARLNLDMLNPAVIKGDTVYIRACNTIAVITFVQDGHTSSETLLIQIADSVARYLP